jgi:hypothetical protein
MNIGLWICTLITAALVMTGGVITSEPVRTGAAVEVQSGPVILAFAAPQGPVQVVAEAGCLSTGCPLIELRIRHAAPQDTRRVHVTTG